MLTLIAESKTMTGCGEIVPAGAPMPMFDREAGEIMAYAGSMSPEELSRALKISLAMTRKLKEMCYEFPNKGVGGLAVSSFTGVVFRALGYATLPERGVEYLKGHLGIVSSVYGLLRSEDRIKAYRMEYGADMGPEGMRLSDYWRGRVTDALLRRIEAEGHEAVIDLLPGDASRCVDWSRIRERAEVVKIDFPSATAEGTPVKSPHSTRLKTLRGHLLRTMAIEGIDTLEELVRLHTDEIMPAGEREEGRIIFQC